MPRPQDAACKGALLSVQRRDDLFGKLDRSVDVSVGVGQRDAALLRDHRELENAFLDQRATESDVPLAVMKITGSGGTAMPDSAAWSA